MPISTSLSAMLSIAFLVSGPAGAQLVRNPSLAAACSVPAVHGGNQRYAVELELFGDDAGALGSGVVTVSRTDGTGTVTVDCDKPRVLMRLQPGDYDATLDMAAGPTRNIRFHVPGSAGTIVTARFAPVQAELNAR
jgi:hypothetical protein